MCISPIMLKGRFVPCRKCVECLIYESTQWAYRCLLEASLYKENCFITLTYNDVNRPKDGALAKKDYQDFLKRLRKRLGKEKIRYFGCGEYGSEKNRPHYHFIIFGYIPKDLEYFYTDNDGHKIYKSEEVAKTWNKGYITVSEMTFSSLKYCAKYLQKLRPEYESFDVKPFCCMSRMPALGYGALTKKMVETDKVYIDGRTIRLCDTFIKKALKDYPEQVRKLKLERRRNAFRLFSAKPLFYFSQVNNDWQYVYDENLYYDFVKNRKKKYKKLLQGLDNQKKL